jgi:hypothetical protein
MPSTTTDPHQDCQRHTFVRNLIERRVEIQNSVKKFLAFGELSPTPPFDEYSPRNRVVINWKFTRKKARQKFGYKRNKFWLSETWLAQAILAYIQERPTLDAEWRNYAKIGLEGSREVEGHGGSNTQAVKYSSPSRAIHISNLISAIPASRMHSHASK